MISFVWPPGASMLAGTGGSETYTAGHVRELLRRGIDVQIVTIGHGLKDGRQDFPDLPFVALADASGISSLPGIVVFVNESYPVPTRNKAAIIFHCPVSGESDRDRFKSYAKDKIVIATSVYSSQQWALYLDMPSSRINAVLPFADPIFANITRSKHTKKTRILFAGRLHPEKGIYTILEMMHHQDMQQKDIDLSIVAAGLHAETGREIARMLENYPHGKLIPARKTVISMAKLLAKSDILLLPSVCAESFGMLSVEAQHTGCRVVASNIGGIPETNCGLLTLVKSRSPRALQTGIKQALALGAATKKERNFAASKFTLSESVDDLLKVIGFKTAA